MNKLVILVSMLLLNQFASAQQERTIDFSKISDVTVFLNKAQVTREFKTRLDAGKTDLVLKGLTSQLDPQSIQVEGKGSFTILGILHQQNYLNELNTPPSLRLLRDSVEYLQRQILVETARKKFSTRKNRCC